MIDMYNCFGGGVTKEALLLVALALGYIVCYFARQEEKAFKLLGIFIGTLIMTLCLSFLLAMAIINVKLSMDMSKTSADLKMYIPRHNRMMMQRMMRPPMPVPPAPQSTQQPKAPEKAPVPPAPTQRK